MRQENREDLENILSNLNEAALNAEPGSQELYNVLDQMSIVIDKIAVLDKQESDAELKDAELDIKSEEVAIKKAESSPRFAKTMRVVEVIAVPLVTVGLESFVKTKWTKMVCRWEKDETFRSTAGRQVSGLFKWKF